MKELPQWRIDNLYAFVGSIIGLTLTLGSFFIYLNRLSVVETKLDMIVTQQQELITEFRNWKTQAETRLGTVEKQITVLNSHHPEIK